MILVVGLTPTVQRTQRFDTLTLGSVNRARETVVTASGKGTNVARVITTLGGSARLITVLGGDSGRYLEQTLNVESVPVQAIWDEDDAPTRTCLTILPSDGSATELVEEARPVSAHDLKLVRAACETQLLEARALCCSGSLPPDVPETFYAELVRAANRAGLPSVVDAQKGALQAVLSEGPFLVKPNREEAAATLGLTLTDDPAADAVRAVAALTSAGAQWALVSMGKSGAILGDGELFWRVTPPTIQAVNPIGSGDSLTAGFLHARVGKQASVPEAVLYGTACAAANCFSLTSGVVSPQVAQNLLTDVRLNPIVL